MRRRQRGQWRGLPRDEGVTQGVPGGHSLVRILDQQSSHEIHAHRGKMPELLVREDGVLCGSGFVHIFHGLPIKRGRAREKHVTEDTERPHIAAIIVVSGQYFRCGVVTTSHAVRQLVFLVEMFGQAEIDEYEW